MRMGADMNNKRGDTIIEVLFAVAVFSMVAVGSLAIMSSGTSTAQRALEITLVRQQIDAQAEALRFIHHSYTSAYVPGTLAYTGPAEEWQNAVSKADATASEFGPNAAVCPSIPTDAFIMNARAATVAVGSAAAPVSMADANSTRPFAQVVYGDDTTAEADGSDATISSVEGIWIEAVTTSSPAEEAINKSNFIDFHIRACWNGPGRSAPMTIGTIVRLYEPRG